MDLHEVWQAAALGACWFLLTHLVPERTDVTSGVGLLVSLLAAVVCFDCIASYTAMFLHIQRVIII